MLNYFIENTIILTPNSVEAGDYLKSLIEFRQNHTGNQWSKFIRTRNEIEHILGLKYDYDNHSYLEKINKVSGLEIIIERPEIKDNGNINGDGKVAYAVYIDLKPFEGTKKDTNEEKRFVVSKQVMKDYLVHTDEQLHLNNNPHRAYALEFYIGEDSKGDYYVIMQHIDVNLRMFICGESHMPIRIPAEE